MSCGRPSTKRPTLGNSLSRTKVTDGHKRAESGAGPLPLATRIPMGLTATDRPVKKANPA